MSVLVLHAFECVCEGVQIFGENTEVNSFKEIDPFPILRAQDEIVGEAAVSLDLADYDPIAEVAIDNLNGFDCRYGDSFDALHVLPFQLLDALKR
jgi:hypothetical protein